MVLDYSMAVQSVIREKKKNIPLCNLFYLMLEEKDSCGFLPSFTRYPSFSCSPQLPLQSDPSDQTGSK